LGSGLSFVQSCTPIRRSAQSAAVAARLSWQFKAFLQSPCLPDRPSSAKKSASSRCCHLNNVNLLKKPDPRQLALLSASIPLCGFLPSRRLNTTACFRRRIPFRCVRSQRFRAKFVRHTSSLAPMRVWVTVRAVTYCICRVYFIPAPSSGFSCLQRSSTT